MRKIKLNCLRYWIIRQYLLMTKIKIILFEVKKKCQKVIMCNKCQILADNGGRHEGDKKLGQNFEAWTSVICAIFGDKM